MAATFNYSVIRVSPSATRGEIVNIGIVVFLKDHLDVRIWPQLQKVRYIDPRVDLNHLFELPETINKLVDGIDSDEERRLFLSGVGGIFLSDFGVFDISRSNDYEAKVEAILNRLVKPAVKPRKREKAPTRLEKSIRDQFSNQGLMGTKPDDIRQHKIIHHYPVSVEDNLYADFALKNTQWHITETLDLRASVETIKADKFKQAAVKAITLDRATKKLKNCIPMVVYAAHEESLDIVQHHINLLSDYSDRIYNYLDSSDMEAYITHITHAAMSPQLQ